MIDHKKRKRKKKLIIPIKEKTKLKSNKFTSKEFAILDSSFETKTNFDKKIKLRKGVEIDVFKVKENID